MSETFVKLDQLAILRRLTVLPFERTIATLTPASLVFLNPALVSIAIAGHDELPGACEIIP